MKIAIIGTGISGLTTAHLLHKNFDIQIFEANDYIGGHTHTIPVQTESGSYMIDTGFIVFNETTYPNFCKIMNSLGVEYQPTEMTFSVKCQHTGVEYSAHSLNTLFAQRKNIFSPVHYRMIWDLFRFRREFDSLVDHKYDNEPLVPYLKNKGYSTRFIELFVLPITASLWSAGLDKSKNFPLGTFVRFFKNHGFLDIKNQFQWQVIKDGSQAYIPKLTEPFKNHIQLNCPVTSIKRQEEKIVLIHKKGTETFDHVILAVHSDQALALLADPSEPEKEILGTIGYQPNDVILHTDTAILPSKESVWASWNYVIPEESQETATLSYDMNILQGIRAPEEFTVSLNQRQMIDPTKIIGTYRYDHPLYTPQVPAAQNRHNEISGVHRTHFCGAYWGYGFHEDGVKSGLEVCKYFGKELL